MKIKRDVGENGGCGHEVETVVLREAQGRLEIVHVKGDTGDMLPCPLDLRGVDIRTDESDALDAAEQARVLRGPAAEVEHGLDLPEVEAELLDCLEVHQRAEVAAREVLVGVSFDRDIPLVQNRRLSDQLRGRGGAGIGRPEPPPEPTFEVSVEPETAEDTLGPWPVPLRQVQNHDLCYPGYFRKVRRHREVWNSICFSSKMTGLVFRQTHPSDLAFGAA